MNKFLLSTLLLSTALTGTAVANKNIDNYQPSTANQVGRYVDHNDGDTYVNPNLYKSFSVAKGNLRSLEYYKDDITEEVGHVIAYGNRPESVKPAPTLPLSPPASIF